MIRLFILLISFFLFFSYDVKAHKTLEKNICDINNFEVFLEHFMMDEKIQLEHIKFPLESSFVNVCSNPEPTSKKVKLAYHQIYLPVIMSNESIKRRKFSLYIKVLRETKEAIVTLFSRYCKIRKFAQQVF